MKILGAVLELPAKQHSQQQPIQPIYFKTGAKYFLSYVKSIATFTLTFFGYIISVLASVPWYCRSAHRLCKKKSCKDEPCT